MDMNTYKPTMIGHIQAKLYGVVMETELSGFIETLRALERAILRRYFSTIDISSQLRFLIDQAKARKYRLYGCFVKFCEAFDRVPTEILFERLKSSKVPY